MVLEQMEQPVPKRIAKMKRTISARPHVWTFARFDMLIDVSGGGGQVDVLCFMVSQTCRPSTSVLSGIVTR